MPYTPATSELLRADLHVLRVPWQAGRSQLERSLEPLRMRPSSAPSERTRAAGALEELARSGERVLAEIESLEAAKARTEADLLAAYAVLHTIETQQIDALPAGAVSRTSAKVSPERVVGEEIALATGVGVGEVSRRLSLATAPRRHRAILAALRSGATTLHRALQVASETSALSDADVTAVEEAVLAPSRDGRIIAQRTFVTRLRRALASVDTRGSDERRAHARSRRGVFGRLTADGMGCLTLVTDADAVAAVMDRLDGEARAARGAGDPRTLDQLRCDLATEALLRRHLEAVQAGAQAHPPTDRTTDHTTGTAVSPSTSRTADRTTSARPSTTGDTTTMRPASGGAADVRAAGAGGRRDGERRPSWTPAPATPGAGHPSSAPHGPAAAATGQAAAAVWLVVPFEVATGTSDAACELPGHGWVTAAHAREIMSRPGSVWRTLPVDRRTGEALSRPTRAYRPTAAMVEHVQAVDGRCRGPGCEVVATRCDLDHETPWPRGETSVGNLHAKHRWHHNAKTDGVWTSAPVAYGGLEWTTLTGRTYVTLPKDWREGVPTTDGDAGPPGPDEAPPPF